MLLIVNAASVVSICEGYIFEITDFWVAMKDFRHLRPMSTLLGVLFAFLFESTINLAVILGWHLLSTV